MQASPWAETVLDIERSKDTCLLASTAIQYNLTLVTRNTDDFERMPVRLINPWD